MIGAALVTEASCPSCRATLVLRQGRYVCQGLRCGLIFPLRYWGRRGDEIYPERSVSRAELGIGPPVPPPGPPMFG